jgi:hypothetical protein
VVDAPVGVAGGGTFHQRQPTFAYSSNDKNQVTVAMEWFRSEGPVNPPSELRHVTLSPWGSWMAAELAPSYLAHLDGGASFAVASAPSNQFALLLSDGGKPSPPSGVSFMPSMSPGSGMTTKSVEVDVGDFALFASNLGNQYLIGAKSSDPSLPARIRTITVNAFSVLTFTPPAPLACAQSLSADAVIGGEGWLVATTSASDFAPSDCNNLTTLDATSIRIVDVDDLDGKAKLVTTLPLGKVVDRLVLARLANGNPWLAWRTSAGDGAARLDNAGKIESQTSIASGPNNRFTAAPFQTGLLVARGGDTSTQLVFVPGNGTASPPISPAALSGMGPVDAIASPDGKSVLLGAVVPGQADRIRVARIRCQ